MTSTPNLCSDDGKGNEGGPVQDVVACVISDPRGRVLIARRPTETRHGGMWEFPGGKLEKDETLSEAADRELEEELGVRLTGAATPDFVRPDPGSHFRIIFVRVTIEGSPRALEHDELAWFDPAGAWSPDFAPADAAYAAWLAQG